MNTVFAASGDGLHVPSHDTISQHTCDIITQLKHDFPKPYEHEQWVQNFFPLKVAVEFKKFE